MTTAAVDVSPMIHPADDVIAVVDDACVGATVGDLRAAGFTEADIHILRGPEGIGVLARAWCSHSGVPASLAPILATVLSDDRTLEKTYRSQGLAEQTVLAVHTHSPDDVDEATRALHGCGSHDTWYFGRWAMPSLELPRGTRDRRTPMEVTTMTIETKEPAQVATDPVAEALARLLADTYTLYLMTHGYHWNVTGPHFRSLHLMFEEQYEELAEAVDEIAERIRQLGPMAPGSYREMARLTEVGDAEGEPDAMGLVHMLLDAYEIVVRTAHTVIAAAEQADDPASLDLATRRIAVHEKTLWMLRATEPWG